MNQEKEMVEITADEKKELEILRKQKAAKERQEKAKKDREAYKELVDEAIIAVFPSGKILATLLGVEKFAEVDPVPPIQIDPHVTI